jgi:hypothetical protein
MAQVQVNDQVRLPFDRGVGVVRKVSRKTADVFVGRKANGSEIIERWQLKALQRTGKRVTPSRAAVGSMGSSGSIRVYSDGA